MDNSIIIIIGSIVLGIAIGFIIAKTLEKNNASKLISEAKKTASSIIKEANTEGEAIKKDKILQAKEKFIELKAEHEKVILSRDKQMAEVEKRTRDKESQVSSELNKSKTLNDALELKIKDYTHKLDILDKKEIEISRLHKSQVEQLEVISSLSAEDAKAQLIESLKDRPKMRRWLMCKVPLKKLS